MLDLEVALEEVDHRQEARRLAVRDGGAFERQPALQAVRVGELIEQPRLTHARLAHHRDHLTVTVFGELLGTAELFQLGVTPNELRQSAPSDGLQAGPRRAGFCYLVNLYSVGQSLDRHRAQRLDLDKALGQRKRGGRDHDRAGIGDLLHPGAQMRRLADGGVVHVEIAADGAHDDLSRIQPNTDLDYGRVGAPHLGRVSLHTFLHPERRVARPHRVILVREGRSE
jgi:hypothetical protein